MSENWKFSELVYERPDKEQAVRDMRETTQKIRDAKSSEEVLALLMEQEKRDAILMDMLTIAIHWIQQMSFMKRNMHGSQKPCLPSCRISLPCPMQ